MFQMIKNAEEQDDVVLLDSDRCHLRRIDDLLRDFEPKSFPGQVKRCLSAPAATGPREMIRGQNSRSAALFCLEREEAVPGADVENGQARSKPAEYALSLCS